MITHCFAANFNSRLYQELSKSQKENINYSPISLKMALNLLYYGTDGETKQYFEKEFAFSASNRRAFKAEYDLMTSIQKNKNSSTKLQLSNSVWFKDVSTIEKDYLKEITSLNVSTGTLDLKMMNDWAAKATQGKITKIIDAITPEMFAVFINAIYFKADWNIPFIKTETRMENFSSSKTTSLKVPMMHQLYDHPYHEDQNAQWLKLSYKDSPFVMYLALPKKRFALYTVEQKLSDDYLLKIEKAMRSKKIQISLPKFKFEQKISLKQTMQDIGLEKLFDKLNYTRLSKNPELSISEIVQATSITVDEKGTEAAAVTAISVLTGMAPPQNPTPFIADQPFLFILKNESTGEIYFMGRVMKP